MSAEREEACTRLIRQARAIVDAEGTGQTALDRIKTLLVDLANAGETLFPPGDFAMPDGHGRNHILALEGNDGMGLYLTIGLPGKETAPHDHAVWCVHSAVSGREVNTFYRRTDDGSRDGYATVEEISQIVVAPGEGMAMTEHAIHATEVLGNQPAIGLALYGYALTRFPAVVWFHPAFSSTRVGANRRAEAA